MEEIFGNCMLNPPVPNPEYLSFGGSVVVLSARPVVEKSDFCHRHVRKLLSCPLHTCENCMYFREIPREPVS